MLGKITMKEIDALNSEFALPGRLFFARGQGGIPVANLNDAHGAGAICLLGAHLLSYRRQDASKGLLWLSDLAEFEVGKSIRGGVPIICPWFGAHPDRPTLPFHGLVRTRLWEVVKSEALADGGTSVTFAFASTVETRAIWEHDFRVEVQIQSRADGLALELVLTNTGATSFHSGSGFHTYFAVSDVSEARVEGLEGVPVLDTLTDQRALQQGHVRFDGEVDAVYSASPEILTLADAERKISIQSQSADSVVVWNPGETAIKKDLAPASYREFVCVETCLAGGAETLEEMAVLEPGASDRYSVRYEARLS
jgi:glucose-6-phosphate 1-epimerase